MLSITGEFKWLVEVFHEYHGSKSCKTLFHETQETFETSAIEPPRFVPPQLQDEFTLEGLVPTLGNYTVNSKFRDEEHEVPADVWNHDTLLSCLNGGETASCGPLTSMNRKCEDFWWFYGPVLHGSTAVVDGSLTISSRPWVEAGLIKNGASHVTTITNRKVTSEIVDLLSVTSPLDMARTYNEKSDEFELFVNGFALGTLEHSGLGCHGEPLSPFGDHEMLARLECIVKQEGLVFLQVPMGHDVTLWGAGRIYGWKTLSLLLLRWEVVDVIGSSIDLDRENFYGYSVDKPIFVIRKRRNPPSKLGVFDDPKLMRLLREKGFRLDRTNLLLHSLVFTLTLKDSTGGALKDSKFSVSMKDATDASQLHFLCWERCKVLVRRRDSVFVDSQNLCVRTLHQLTVQGIVDELRKEEYRDEVNAMDPHVHIRGISIGKDIMSQIERKLSLVLEVFQAMDALDDSYQQYDLKVFSDDSSEVFEFVLAELLEPTVFVSRARIFCSVTLSLVEEEEVVRCTQMITEKAFDLILAEESVAILESTKLKLKESKNVLHAGLVFQQEKSDVEVEAQ